MRFSNYQSTIKGELFHEDIGTVIVALCFYFSCVTVKTEIDGKVKSRKC